MREVATPAIMSGVMMMAMMIIIIIMMMMMTRMIR